MLMLSFSFVMHVLASRRPRFASFGCGGWTGVGGDEGLCVVYLKMISLVIRLVALGTICVQSRAQIYFGFLQWPIDLSIYLFIYFYQLGGNKCNLSEWGAALYAPSPPHLGSQ